MASDELDFIHDINNKLSIVKDGAKIHSELEGDSTAKNYIGDFYNNNYYYYVY